MLRFLFLGTSAGLPTRRRNVTALAVQWEGSKHWSLVDCGEGTQRQLQETPCSLARIDHIFITHLHGDHVLGLPGLISSRYLLDVDQPLTLVGPAGLQDYLRLTFTALGSRWWGRFPVNFIEWQEGETGTFEMPPFRITAIPLQHNLPCWAYLWEEVAPKRAFLVDKARQLGIPPGPYYQILKSGNDLVLPDGRCFRGVDFLGPAEPSLKFIVGGDNAEPERLAPYLQDAQLLIHEATYSEADMLNLGKVVWHSSARRVGRVAAEAKLPHLILTHFSPRYKDAAALAAIERDARSSYSGRLELAEDFAVYELSRHGDLRRAAEPPPKS